MVFEGIRLIDGVWFRDFRRWGLDIDGGIFLGRVIFILLRED